MKSITIVLAVLIMTGLGCASAYQPKGITGGFSDQQVTDDEFIIQFSGNGFTSSERANEFTVMRSADVCLGHGFSYFKFLDEQVGTNVAYMQSPGYASTYGSVGKGGYYSSTVYSVPGVTEIRRPIAAGRIKCYTNLPAGEELGKTIFDAKNIQALGKKKYGL